MNQNTMPAKEILEKLPKADLHVHLDGSIRLETLIDLAKQQNLELPSNTVHGLHETLFKSHYNSLEDYLKTFGYSCAVMQTPENLERIAYEFAIDNQNEGVRYVEARFAPQLMMNSKQDMPTVLKSVNRGMERAQREFNQKTEVASGKEPPFYYGIIACAMRNFGAYSEYYRQLLDVVTYSDPMEIRQLASWELAKAVVQIRDSEGIPLVGFDLAGAEDGYPAKEHLKAFQYAHDAFMRKTVHAGEAYGPESIFQAITDIHADRIGHGYYLFDESKIQDEKIKNKTQYVERLCQYISQRRVTIEVCLTSNMQTNPSIKKMENHNFSKMLDHRMSATLCTDNRTVSRTTLTNEFQLALDHFDISPKQLKHLMILGFRRSFFPGTYQEKCDYVRQCEEYYNKLVSAGE